MDKKVLKERLDEIIKQIKTNSKDAHFADKLIGDLLSVKGQLGIEPLELDCGKKVAEFLGETYRITLTDKGVLYHEYGGYNIFVTPNNEALYETLANIVINKDAYASASYEDKEKFELTLSAVGYCLTVPKIAFTDVDLTFDIAKRVIDFIMNQYKELMNAELQEETPVENAEFKEATLAVETLKEAIANEQQ